MCACGGGCYGVGVVVYGVFVLVLCDNVLWYTVFLWCCVMVVRFAFGRFVFVLLGQLVHCQDVEIKHKS